MYQYATIRINYGDSKASLYMPDPEESGFFPYNHIDLQLLNDALNKLGAEGWCMVARHENTIHLMRAVMSPTPETTINKDIILCSDPEKLKEYMDSQSQSQSNILDEPQPTKSKFMG
jgi:hypothetical protein